MTQPADRFQIPKHFGRRPDASQIAASTLEETAANSAAMAQHRAALAVFDELARRDVKLDWLGEQLGEHIDQLRRKLHGKSNASAKDLAAWSAVLGLTGDPFPAVDTAAVPAPAALSGAQVGSKLWSMANTLRAAGVRPADYQAFILPVLMFKVVCDRYDAARDEIVEERGVELWESFKDELAPFVIPPGCSFTEQREVAGNLGESLRTALIEIEKANSELAGAFLGTDYADLTDDAVRELYAVLGSVSFSPAQTSQDALGQAYEYLLGKFADAAGAKAGQFFTPVPVAQLLVRLVAPQPGEAVYDPTCGSGGLLNAAAEYVAAQGHLRGAVSLHGQEIDSQSHAIAKVNMFLHGNSGEIAKGDTLLDPKFADDESLRTFECSVANPPFGLVNTAHSTWDKDRFGRYRWGTVTRKPAELAFVAHVASSLKGLPGTTPEDEEPVVGRAAIVLPMGALFRKGVEAGMRQKLLEAGMVDSVIALPENLFFNTSIPASILVLRTSPRRDGHVLFVDASAGFTKVKKQNTLDPEHIAAIEEAVTTGADCDRVRALLVSVGEIAAADCDLSVSRWLPKTSAVHVDVPGAAARLLSAEAESQTATYAFWIHLEAAGYEL